MQEGINQEGRLSNNPLDDRIRRPDGVFKVGAVSRTLISVDRLQALGHDVVLMKNHARIINVKTGEIMLLRKSKRNVHLVHVDVDFDEAM